MKLIVGLGNPGSSYAHTRHNMGRLIVEYAAASFSRSFLKKKVLEASVITFDWESCPAVLAYPENFMNISGRSVEKLVRHFDVEIGKDLLVVTDDVALPFGRLRLRGSGSDGGHNGLKSIHEFLGTSRYARLRIGIGPRGKDKTSLTDQSLVLESYVLSRFNREEEKDLEVILRKGVRACHLWASQKLEMAMNAVNPKND